MDLLDLFVKIGVKDEASEAVASIGGKLKSGLATAGKVAAAGVGLVTAAAGAAAGALSALEGATEEYRVAQGKLNTAFEAAGYSTETAQQAYAAFYGILGDTDTATEASQLLAKLADSQEDVSTWTNLAAGVWGTFGDSLPIEGLIEASNETAKTGTVVGVLADALNWAGISEDDFNAKLAACSDESERNQLIMDTLSATYDGAADAFYRNNDALVSSRNAQAQLMSVMSELATTVQTIKTGLISDFLPSIVSVADALNGMLSGTEGASEQFATALEDLVSVAVNKLPEFLSFGTKILVSIVNGLISGVPVLVASAPQMLSALGSAIIESSPALVSTGSSIIDSIKSGIATGLPNLVSSASSAMSAFASYLSANFPALVESGIALVSYLGTSIISNLSPLLDSALQIVESVAGGIISNLPQLAEAAVQIITSLIEFISSSFPQIVDTGVSLLGQLLTGIIDAIPVLVAGLPQVISAIVSFIISNLPTILSAGAKLLASFISGIVQAIPSLVAALPQVITAFVNGIGALMGSVVNVGKNIVQGVWEGIQSMVGWFTSKVKNFFSGIVNSVKNTLGIHSPSTVFAGIGGYMAEGLGKGWDDQYDKIRRDIESGMDFGTATVDVDSSASGRQRAALDTVSAAGEQAITIVVQSVLDGKVIGETAYQYSRNRQRAYGVV